MTKNELFIELAQKYTYSRLISTLDLMSNDEEIYSAIMQDMLEFLPEITKQLTLEELFEFISVYLKSTIQRALYDLNDEKKFHVAHLLLNGKLK